MIRVPLQSSPNQEFNIPLDGNRFDIEIKESNGVMAVSIDINEENILLGQRVLAGVPLIPYRYLESGNFIFITNNDEIPYYTQFGINQRLIYATQEELEAIRNAA